MERFLSIHYLTLIMNTFFSNTDRKYINKNRGNGAYQKNIAEYLLTREQGS